MAGPISIKDSGSRLKKTNKQTKQNKTKNKNKNKKKMCTCVKSDEFNPPVLVVVYCLFVCFRFLFDIFNFLLKLI